MNQSPLRQDPAPGWRQSLATGAPGIGLLHIEYARTGFGRWEAAHQWTTAMTKDPVTAHPDACGLYQGAPAVAFALNAAGHPGYAAALDTLDDHLVALTRHRLELARERIDRGRLPQLREFDLISGLTGLGAYLLSRDRDGDLLRDVLAYLARLTEPLANYGEELPGWWTGTGPDGRPSPDWPGGHANFGVAHGIAGPLALLSMAMRRGITIAGHADAIHRICACLDQWRTGPRSQAWWPATISLPEWQARALQQHGPQRPSWCYGTPGLARAQQLAALALTDPRRQQLAEGALTSCVTDERQLSQLIDASLCHGWAGLAQTTWRAAIDAGSDSELATRLPSVLTRMKQYLRRQGPPICAGLLDGSAGVRLAQHTTGTNAPPASRWDVCLLLDG